MPKGNIASVIGRGQPPAPDAGIGDPGEVEGRSWSPAPQGQLVPWYRKSSVSWSEVFLAHAGAWRERLEQAPDLEQRLADVLEKAHAAWPGIDVAPEVFLAHLAQRLPADRDPIDLLPRLHVADVYLTCACAQGLSAAMDALDTQFLTRLDAHLARSDALTAVNDEIKQRLRVRLLLAKDGLVPKIAMYNGLAPLFAWLRILATRLAVDMRRAEQGTMTAGDSVQGFRSPAPDPELDYLKTRYRPELESAFQSTLASLSARQSTILRLYFLDGMSTEAIGLLYRVSSRTVQRWIGQTRRKLLEETKRLLGDRLKLDPTQLDTLMGLVQSELEVSLHRILGERSAAPDDETS